MITQALEGDRATLLVSQLFDNYADAIFAYLYRLVNNRETAEELTQETFLRAFNARRQLDAIENRRAWVYRVATNVAFDTLRRGRRFVWLPWSQADELHAPHPDVADATRERDSVERTLAALPLDYRAPLLLYVVYGLSVLEVAGALGIREGAAKMRIRRAREMFRKAYGPHEDGVNGGLP